MTSLLFVELLKMRKRWLPYLLFLVMVAGVAMLIWLGGYAEFHSSERDSRALGLHTMAIPWSLVAEWGRGKVGWRPPPSRAVWGRGKAGWSPAIPSRVGRGKAGWSPAIPSRVA